MHGRSSFCNTCQILCRCGKTSSPSQEPPRQCDCLPPFHTQTPVTHLKTEIKTPRAQRKTHLHKHHLVNVTVCFHFKERFQTLWCGVTWQVAQVHTLAATVSQLKQPMPLKEISCKGAGKFTWTYRKCTKKCPLADSVRLPFPFVVVTYAVD